MEVWREGEKEGKGVGCIVLVKVGIIEGVEVVGALVVGVAVGISVYVNVGVPVGAMVGDTVGSNVFGKVGVAVGAVVGDAGGIVDAMKAKNFVTSMEPRPVTGSQPAVA